MNKTQILSTIVNLVFTEDKIQILNKRASGYSSGINSSCNGDQVICPWGFSFIICKIQGSYEEAGFVGKGSHLNS